MPTLDWIGKRAVVNHHRELPYRLLHCDPALSAGDPGAGNLLVEGDNLHALKALLPYYAGQVKCIYIDPPYNTGDEGWVYNDNVNSPEIQKWLGETVGKEAEDLSRHDKWLCMMYPRLALLREFLREDGVIFVSIDDNEFGNLRHLMNEVFGSRNLIGTMVWKRRSSSAMRGTPLSVDHEYLFVYGRSAEQTTMYGLAKGPEGYPFEDARGRYASTDLTVGMGRDARPNQFYSITNPRTGKVYEANPERVWRFFPATMQKVIEADLIIWPDEAGGAMQRPRYKTYYDPATAKAKPISSWIETASTNDKEVTAEEEEFDINILRSGMNQEGGKLMQEILGTKAFTYPKPLSLARSLIRASTRGEDFVMDSFAGSGTTGHAVLALNKEDGGNRRFILCELESKIAREITAERLKRVIAGYGETPGLGGGFRFCTLGEPLFNEDGHLRADVKWPDLAHHLWFSETGAPLPAVAAVYDRRDADAALHEEPGGHRPPLQHSPLLGVTGDGRALYLLYNGILGDRRPEGGNVLTTETLALLPPHGGPRVVYGEACTLRDAVLQRERITFKQIPYQVRQQ